LLNLTIKQLDSAGTAVLPFLSCLAGYQVSVSTAGAAQSRVVPPSNDALLGGGGDQVHHGGLVPRHVAGLVAHPAPAVRLIVQPQLAAGEQQINMKT